MIVFEFEGRGVTPDQKVTAVTLVSRRVVVLLALVLILASGCGEVDGQSSVASLQEDSPEAITSPESSPTPQTVGAAPEVESVARVDSPTPTATLSTLSPTANADSSTSISPATDSAPTTSSGQTEMTVAEYAKWCALVENKVTDSTGLIWGDFKAMLTSVEAAYSAVDPPNVLAEYHNHRTALISVTKSVAEEKDASLLVKPEDLLDPRIFAIALVGPSISDFPSEIRQQLVESGCISEDSATGSSVSTEVRRVEVGEEFGAGVEGVSVTVDGFSWEEEIRASEYLVSTPDDGSKFLIVLFTIRNSGDQDFDPWDVKHGFYVEDSNGVQNHGVLISGIDNVSEERWGVIAADVARAGRTVRTLQSYEVKDRASDLVLRSDDFGVFLEIPDRS